MSFRFLEAALCAALLLSLIWILEVRTDARRFDPRALFSRRAVR